MKGVLMKNQYKHPFVCVQCGQMFHAPENSMPLVVAQGHICSNQCLTAHFRQNINQPQFEGLCEIEPSWEEGLGRT